MEKNDEENEIGPNGESNNSQETGEGSDTNNNSDSSSDSSEQGNEFYENLSSESSSTVLVSENKEEMQEDDQDELEREIEKELEEGVEGINKYLEEEAEFINAYQEMVEKERALDGERELEGDECQMTDEEWEKEVETAAYTAEQLYESMQEIETNTFNEEISEIKEELEIEKEVEQSEEISEPQLSDTKEENSGLYEEVDKEKDELEQHQVESAIQEELETEHESIVKEKEIEQLQELAVEEQFQIVHFNEYVDELVEKQNEEAEKLKEQVEKEELEAQASKIKEANFELYEEIEVERDELEQHQVESAIQGEFETEPEPIINEKEVEKLQELDVEEQFQMVYFNEYMDELVEKQNEEAEKLKEQEGQVEKEELEAQASKIKEANFELYEEIEVERDELDQHQVEPLIEEELETEPESIVDEKEVEKLQELDVEEQFQIVYFNEYIDELVERQDEDKNIENDKIKQEKENIEQTQDVIHQSTYLQEKLEEQEQELELDYEEKDIVEQHQVEAAIEEELKTEPKPIVNEEELEYIKNLEHEKQVEAELFYEFIEELANKQNEEKEEREENEEQEEISTEQKIAQITRELDIPQEINADEIEVENNRQEGELEQEPTFPDEGVVEQLEIEESIDHRQELEEILEQNRKIEQEALIEIEKEEEDSDKTVEKNYERVKRFYKQQTGKRPIYANKETKGFKQWLEQKKKSEEKEKPKQKQEIKEEQKKEEGWKTTLKRWIKEASEEECNAELKSKLRRALESYNEFEYLTRKFLELYKKSQHEKLTEIEKNRLKSLTERLQGLGPIQLELLENIRAFKDYFNNHLWELMNRFFANRVRSEFFKNIYKKLRKEQKAKENLEEILNNWIEQASEEEISPELKVLLKKIVENYSELEELAIRFMELYKKEQFEQISQSEKVELKSLIKTLEKLDPINIVLFANIRAIKRYLNDQHLDDFSNKTRFNRVLNKFFKHVSQKYENLKPQMLKLKELINSGTEKILMNQIRKSGGIVRIFKFEPRVLVKIIEQLGRSLNVILDIKDKIYLQKKKNNTYSSSYSDGDIEFWIELFKLKYYGGSWPAVFNFIIECNKRFNLKIITPHYYNGMIPIVKVYCKHNSLNYEEFLIEYGAHKTKKPPTDEIVHDWIKIYQDRELGGSISAIMKYLEKLQGYTLGETTIRRHIRKFFLNGKYTDYFGTNLSYEEWIKIYKRKYFREDIPLDPKIQSHEYILVHNIKKNQYKLIFIKDLENPELLENMDEIQILGISNNLQPKKVNISHFEKKELQKSLEIVCSHGSVIISPDQYLFTINNDCNIIEIKGSDLKVGTPILMPRILKIDSNDEPLDLINCGKLITSNNIQYIEQFSKRAYRFIKKNANLGAIIGQYEAEGTFPSKYQPATTISVSVDNEYIQKLQKILKEVFGLEFQIFARRVTECKNCGSKTIEKGNQNICPKCEDGIYNECYELRTKTKLAKTIFTEGLGLKHAYSYLKEIPSFLYNSPTECDKGFILSYFKGDGSERDYRNKGGTFDLNFETTSRRLVFGLNFLMKKLGVVMSVSEHNPPSTRPNSKKLYSMLIRGSSNFEKLKQFFDNLPEIDYTTTDIRTSANTQVLMRKLNLELQEMYGISLRELSNKGIIPKNAAHVATQVKRKTNLTEVLLLKTLDGVKNEKIATPLVEKLEQVFRNNTFTKIKKIRDSKTPNETYKISVEGIGYCSGTAFVYVKSEENKKEK